MARGRKGKAVSGWLVVDKPAGVTSTSVVGKVRWALDAQKAGHAGTLDPAATGVLAIALGEATKTVPFITDAVKCYRFRIRFGAATTTDDAEGDVIDSRDGRPSDAQIETALEAFRGDIMQVPPQFSAVKVDGERAYDIAREGEAMELAARPLWVERLELLGRPDADHADLEMVCGKGGYVRSIARDLGRALGCLGHVAWLRREWSGPFHADAGISLDEIERMARTPDLEARLLPVEAGLQDLPQVQATDQGAVRLRNGNPGQVIGNLPYGTECWASHQGRAVAVGRYMGGELHPSRVFAI
ncbi:tRNA pseudouridine synthase B [Gemmobacter megaterium]|uniref:tRNA pseudouridine synthase B n=1 Tax=Gemmobacter megaterium TaxID=1086013 RepID=A0A1N7Q3T7_9RHOB|nr:tRNA pseudouridine(55) synthase TruB [Gemmobacter megaterium]GGE22639.1 tRNA pseudouridine synthase B [Gemmobacter megaterium]SIT17379.1 tRNA pseudouridine synthase B [Gemmobacter megaterium]